MCRSQYECILWHWKYVEQIAYEHFGIRMISVVTAFYDELRKSSSSAGNLTVV